MSHDKPSDLPKKNRTNMEKWDAGASDGLLRR